MFDGSGSTPWKETDPVGPLNVYGHTKLAGEQAIQATWEKHLIFRTSWVFGVHGNNFIKTMLRLAQERDSLNVVNDQVGAPTAAALIAEVTVRAINQAHVSGSCAGLYHLAAAGEVSWFGYAQHVLAVAKEAGVTLRVQPEQVGAIFSAQFPTPARRPANSRLACARLEQMLGKQMPPWQIGVDAVMSRFLARD